MNSLKKKIIPIIMHCIISFYTIKIKINFFAFLQTPIYLLSIFFHFIMLYPYTIFIIYKYIHVYLIIT